MINGTEICLVDEDCNGNKYYFKKDDYVTITTRNYLSKDGYNINSGRIDKILPIRNELYLDISEDNNSKYVCIGFGEIINIFKIIDDDGETETDTFNSDTYSMLMTTIPNMLTDILKQITANRLQCKKYHEPEIDNEPQVIINP